VNALEDRYQWLFSLNPMTGAITGLRWSLLGSPLPWQTVVVGSAMACVFIVAGLAFFRHAEPRFADTI
jgi:lipopolysaccharide transport system permease protein